MIDFVGPARVQVRPQGLKGSLRATRVESIDSVALCGVMLLDEGLDGLDGGVHRPGPDPRRQRTGQPAGAAPKRQQPAAVPWRQQLLDRGEMRRFGGEVPLRKTADGCVRCDRSNPRPPLALCRHRCGGPDQSDSERRWRAVAGAALLNVFFADVATFWTRLSKRVGVVSADSRSHLVQRNRTACFKGGAGRLG